jgi:hypothetical protein
MPDRRLQVVLKPERTVTYWCLNRACERFERPTEVLIEGGKDEPKRRQGPRPVTFEYEQPALFDAPTRAEKDEGLSCYVCGRPLSSRIRREDASSDA